jgi:hypothetical protein
MPWVKEVKLRWETREVIQKKIKKNEVYNLPLGKKEILVMLLRIHQLY